jgi:glycosyltransferase involved in cell wall biosynthesis
MKILHLLKTTNGADWAFRQMKELAKLGLEIHAAAPEGGPLIRYFRDANIKWHNKNYDIANRKPWEWIELFNDFKKLIADIKPDLIHSHFVGTTLTMRLSLGRKSGIPRIFQVPGPLHLENKFFRKSEIFFGGKWDYWVGSCKWTYDCYLREGIPKEKIFLSYYGLDLEAFRHAGKGKLRNELKVDQDTPVIGMVAYMYPPKRYLGKMRGIKGHEDLIDAIAICSQKYPNLVGVFIGGAWQRAFDYENQVIAYGKKKCPGNVVFLGNRSDVSELYPDFDVAVHPSHSENLGGAAESLIMGIPTVTTSVGGFPDIVLNGKTGWIVPPRNPSQIAHAIFEALEDPKRGIAKANLGKKMVSEMLDVRNTAREVFEIYKRIYSGRN